MMWRTLRICGAFLTFACLVTAHQAGSTAGQAATARTIEMTAHKYQFTPKVVRVRQGEDIDLKITSLDTTHGFQIKPLDIKEDLPKGQAVTIHIPTNQPGTYTFHCSHFCGLGHRGMKGTLIVEPAGATTSAPR
jgi:cytochrome c oxidase subunit 2